MKKNANNVSVLLFVVSILSLVSGIVVGFVISLETGEYFNLIIWPIAGFISFVFIRGFSEVIQLLQDIKDKQ